MLVGKVSQIQHCTQRVILKENTRKTSVDVAFLPVEVTCML
jgi:hypothetical protein